jgi:hypothetical protein
LERELEDLKERVRATERRIQDEKNFMASSKQEEEDLATQLKTACRVEYLESADSIG